jgi:hypothetical protein
MFRNLLFAILDAMQASTHDGREYICCDPEIRAGLDAMRDADWSRQDSFLLQQTEADDE